MSTTEAVKLYEVGRRGRPIKGIRPGDLADPYGKTPWQHVVSFARTIADIAREARELETRMLAGGYRRGES
ncbi:MAG: hypothetical protein IT518_21365 [Burkholderiales bacterium]|nr:hypothetical protein [Burkholderiales bacterium]